MMVALFAACSANQPDDNHVVPATHDARKTKAKDASPVTTSAQSLLCELSVTKLSTPSGAAGAGGAGQVLQLAFRVTNTGTEARRVRYFAPFLSFTLAIEANGKDLAITQPAVDIGVRPVVQELGANETMAIETPVTLQFADQGTSSDRFTWTIQSPPTKVTITATVELDGESLGPCSAAS